MTRKHELPDDVAWQADGHLSDPALVALADGQTDVLSEAALAHADGCESCSARLGEHALLSIAVGESLAESAAVASASAPRPVPVLALLLGLALALAGAVPSLLDAPRWLSGLPTLLVQGVPVALRALGALLRTAPSTGSVPLMVSFAAALVLAALGLLVARRFPRDVAWKGVEK